MSIRSAKSFCRICSAGCGTILNVDGSDRVVGIRGDKENALSRGYVCFKGLQAEEAHHGPARLLHPLKRESDGSFVRISLERALDEIAAKLQAIMARDGADAVAVFHGSGGQSDALGTIMSKAFAAALGSPFFSTMTIDQSAKFVAFERLGAWAAGLQDIEQSKVLLFVGTNPLISHAALPVLGPDPTKRLKAAKQRGVKLIVVDPRKTETAHFADLFVQPLPGQDAAMLAGLLRIILDERWHDLEFCAAHIGAARMQDLRTAVEPFSEEMVERRAGIHQGELRAIAKMFARDHSSGAAYCSTGPCMAPFSNLTQHLVETLNVVCGRVRRTGDEVVVDLASPDCEVRAEVIAPPRSWQSVPRGRIRGVGLIAGERLTGTLAEEITTPGKGQIRALIINGANVAAAVPDQRRIVDALRSLELLVAIETHTKTTNELAHYLLPPFAQYERPDLPMLVPGISLIPDNFLQVTPAILSPPRESELGSNWYMFWSLAKRLRRQIRFAGEPINMETPPTSEELLAIRLSGTRAPYEELKQYPSGVAHPRSRYRVAPGRPQATARFDVVPPDVEAELRDCAAQRVEPGRFESNGQVFTHLLSSRRLRDTFNSNGIELEAVRKRTPYNAAYMNPADLAQLGLASGDRITITSDAGSIEAIVEAEPEIRSQVISMAHSWGDLPDRNSNRGVCVGLLIDSTRDVEPVNAMPRMSAIPVNVARAPARPSSSSSS